jgi:periplasmic protein TonB
MFEQSVLPDGPSKRPRTFLLVTTAEVLVLAATIILPLFWIGGPSIPKLPPIIKFRPRSMPIEVVPVEPTERSRTRPSSFRVVFDPRLTNIQPRPSTNREFSMDDAPQIGAPVDASAPWGIDHSTSEPKPVPPPSPQPPPKPAPIKPADPIRVSQGVQEAKLVHRVMPVYPKLAIQTRQFGTVHMVAVIGKDGRMRDIQVLSGPVFLVQAALEAVKQWVYKPTYLNGEPVEVVAPITVNFTLSP